MRVSKTLDVSSSLAAPAKIGCRFTVKKGELALKIIEMEKVRLYFVEAYDELVNKVTWPTWAELQESSVIVLVSALIISLIVVAMDILFKEGTQELYKLIIGG